MSEENIEIAMVDVPRHDVTVTMDDILAPLARTEARLKAADLGMANAPEVAEQLSRFTELVTSLHEVSRTLDRADPSLLQSKPSPPLEEQGMA